MCVCYTLDKRQMMIAIKSKGFVLFSFNIYEGRSGMEAFSDFPFCEQKQAKTRVLMP